MKTEILFKEESFKIMGACFEVYNGMGHGFLEAVYQECLALEFADQLDESEARMFLSQWTRVLKQLAANLEEAKSPYAPLVRLVEDRAQLVKAAA